MQNKISVIIPVYNLEKYLARTLDSVLAQTYKNLEIILVNDGSADESPAIMEYYASLDSRIKTIHKENGGVTSARLSGVGAATGDWIGFVDGDDLIEPEMFERLIKNALHYQADISHCGYQMVFPSRVDYYYNTAKLVEQDHTTGLRDLIAGGFVEPSLWNKLFRRNLFDGLAKKMDLSIKINEDVLMNYWLFKAANRSIFEDICLYHYIVRAGSAANSRLNTHLLCDPLKVTKAILEDADNVLRPVAMKRLAQQLIANASMPASDQPELVRPFRKECRRELRQRLKEFLRCPGMGHKLQLMALFAAIWPAGYGLVHKLYARISGLDKKYEIS